MNISGMDKSKLAKSGEEYIKLLASDADYITRSNDDFREVRRAGYGVIAKLPEADFEDFISGLHYNKGGVSHGSYRPLTRSLAITEVFAVFELMGMDRTYALDCLEEKCEGGGCVFSFWDFCSSLNCPPSVLQP